MGFSSKVATDAVSFTDACPFLLLSQYELCMLSVLSFLLEIKRTPTPADNLLHNASSLYSVGLKFPELS